MLVGIISIFPEMFKAITSYGITSQAIKKGLLSIKIWNPRCFVNNLHHTVDDRPYGGGPGMLMLAKPLYDAIMAAKKSINNDTKVIFLSPQGRKLDQTSVRELASNQRLILVCGRYEGIDERVIQTTIDEEWSVGDYILSGGELAAMILIDTVSRFIPGVLNHAASAIEDSFVNGLLEYQNYSRPKVFKEIKVPAVLVSGNHSNIYRWRLKQSLGRTWLRRPDLLQKKTLNKEEIRLLLEFLTEYKQ